MESSVTGKQSSSAWKMTFFHIKPTAWAYLMITLGTGMLNSVFSFYYVKLFLHLHKISEMAFYQAQVFHLTFFNNFMMIFAETLIPSDVLSSSMRSIMYGAGFICPQCLVLIMWSCLKKCGYYQIILISFYLEGAASVVMLLLGQEYCYCLALYLTIIMVLVQASSCLFHLPLVDMVDEDLLKSNRQSPLYSVIFGFNALLTKPAQPLAPIVILSRLAQYDYGNPNSNRPM